MIRIPKRLSACVGVWKGISLVVFALAIALVPSLTFAQLNLGHILGAVTDQSGGVIVGATVTVTDVARGISRPLTTDSAGEYNAPSLIPGTYTVSAAAKGFQTEQRQNIVVGVGEDVRVDLKLQPGETTQTVTVTEAVPMVNTADAQLGATVDNQVINDLPLEGRLYTKLLDFRPGMTGVPGGKTPTYSSNGIRANDNEWLFDGLDDVNVYGATGPTVSGNNGFDQITILPVDAIQEIKIIENPKAEYGWRPGAQVNVGLKSGTNDIHGTAYAFGRDTDLDAKNQFLGPNLPRAEDALEQPGVTIGGPIKKDKLFFFAGYEGKRFTVGSPRTQQMPSSVSGAGPSSSFVDAITAMNTAHEALSPLSLALAGCTSAGVCNPANGLFNNGLESPTEVLDFNSYGSSDNAIGKVDYHPNDHNALNGEYFFGTGAQVSGAGSVVGGGGGAQPYWLSVDDGKAQVLRGVWVWTPNSSWVNEARFGYDRYNQPVYPQACVGQATQPNLGALGLDSGLANSDLICGPSISITSFAGLGAGAGMTILSQQWAGLDSVSYTRGKHQFKFGGEVRTIGCACAALLTNLQGSVSFGTVPAFTTPTTATALEDFLSGVPSTGSVLLGPVNRNLANNRYAGFAQDDWRITSKVILNLGLRYEYETPMTEQNNQLGNFNANTPTGLIQATSSDRTVYKGYPYDFAPRFGMAWDVFGKGTTVVRLDATILDDTSHAYNVLDSSTGTQLGNVPTGFALYNTNGTTRTSPGTLDSGTVAFSALTTGQFAWASNTPIFNATTSGLACGNGLGSVTPGAVPSASNLANPAPCKIVPINPNFRTAYITSWGLDVQQAITNNLTLDVAYVGNHGSQLSEQLDINQPTPGPSNGKAPNNELQLQRSPYYSQFPYFSQIVLYTNGGLSNYNSVQVKLIQRLSRGATFTAGYTLDHSLDIASSELSNQPMDSYDPSLDYGDSSGIPFQHFTFTASYVIPGRKSPGQMLEGWQINTALNLLGSLPIGADDTTDNISGTGENEDRWTLSGPASGFKGIGGPSQVPCYGVAAGNETINGNVYAFTQSSFSKTTNCITVAAGAMPAACVNTAANEPNSPSNVIPSGTPSTAPTLADNTALYELYTLGCYYQNGSAIVPPAQGTYGSMGRDVLRGLPFREWDFSVVKDWKFRERYSAQFRVEFFNFLNSPAYAAGASNLGSPSTFGESTALPNSTNPIIGNGGPRVMQLGLKLGF